MAFQSSALPGMAATISNVLAASWASLGLRTQRTPREIPRKPPAQSLSKPTPPSVKSLNPPIPEFLRDLPPTFTSIHTHQIAPNFFYNIGDMVRGMSKGTFAAANPLARRAFFIPHGRQMSTLSHFKFERPSVNFTKSLAQQRRTAFGASSSRNLLAHMEETANKNPNSATAQNAFYSALLRADMPAIIVERYQTNQFATNAACEAVYHKALGIINQSGNSVSGNQFAGKQTGNLTSAQLQAVGQAVAASHRGSNVATARAGPGNGEKNAPLHVVVEETIGGTIFKWVKFLFYFSLITYISMMVVAMLIEGFSTFKKVGGKNDKEAKAEHQNVRFTDVHGCDEAKEELQELVDFLRNPEKFSTLGGKLPKGVLLVGPPGTGKTLLARAVAGEAGVPFFFMSGSEFDEVYVGVGAKRVRELFEAAKSKSPAIVFIDELDAIGGKRNARDAAYVKQTLNQLLTELDGFEQNSGVIILAATNFPEMLDKALTRPGRFDRNVVVGLPDVRGRIAILQHHMKKIIAGKDVSLEILAAGTSGFSGAELENVINQAAVHASKAKAKAVSMFDFEWAKDKVMMGAEKRSMVITQKEKEITAYHEAGHALVVMFTPGANTLHKITIMPRGMALGMTMHLPEMDKYSVGMDEYLAQIDTCLGGKVAEELIYGADKVTSGVASDLQQATKIAYAMVTRFGMSSELGNVDLASNHDKLSPATKRLIESEVRRVIEESRVRATALIQSRRKELDYLAKALLDYETLSKEEAYKVIKGQKLEGKIVVPQGSIKIPDMPTAVGSEGNRQENTLATSPSLFLPPVTRVSSTPYEVAGEYSADDLRVQTSKTNGRPRDIQTFSNHQRIAPYAVTQRPGSAGNAVPVKYNNPQFLRSQTGMNSEGNPRPRLPEQNHTFGNAGDLTSKPVLTGRRPTGARLPSPPPAPATAIYDQVPPKSGKTRLNLLNPMALLARRRTSQATVQQLSPEPIRPTGYNFSESFDPRIRGTVVHDFSAPRPKRNTSYNDIRTQEVWVNNRPTDYQRRGSNQQVESASTEEGPGSGGPWSGGNHTPVFTENFEEEQYPAAGPHVRKASDISDLPLPKPPYAQGTLKIVDSDQKSNGIEHSQVSKIDKISIPPMPKGPPPPPPPKPKNELPIQLRRISINPTSTPPKSTLSSKKGRSRNVSEASIKDALPSHMKSTSSRFSFDMIGAAEQERLLEDRHRQRALEKKNTPDEDERDQFDDEMDDYDYDNMDDDEGLEERIPGVNADLDEDDVYEEMIPGVNVDLEDDVLEESILRINSDLKEDSNIIWDDSKNIAGFTFQQLSVTPMSPNSPGIAETPRDANGDVIGFAMTKNSPYLGMPASNLSNAPIISSPSDIHVPSPDQGLQGLGLQGVDVDFNHEGQSPKTQPSPSHDIEVELFNKPQTSADEDDLYFDDGMIEEIGEGDDNTEFDESVFDNADTDEYGRPLRALSSMPTLYSPPNLTSDASPSINQNQGFRNISQPKDNIEEDPSPKTVLSTGGLALQPSISAQPSTTSPSLTQSSLAAYQSALAAATHIAALNGKFNRSPEPAHPSPPSSQDFHPGLITDSSSISRQEPFSPSYEDDFDYDDALSDDPIIAAANAEALANDSDGFYGQEFGFYSAPAAGEAEYANGGYFGPRGVDGINRSQSGRIVSREPNLTPITERSEYSNRNSFMSPQLHGLSSPGLVQLAGLMNTDYESDMTLNALLKLRRGAWGGSQASLHSSNGGSPRSAGAEDPSPSSQPPWSQNVNQTQTQGHRRKGSAFSLVSEDDSEPTLTLHSTSLEASTGSLQSQTPKAERRRKHSYTGSNGSISYLKEDDPEKGGERWVLERRRTSESGVVEVAGREVLGGRI
ncbi:hypothetical protein B7494_g7230 [Chlorociboria aeruginascens]|nr:hypothetical protein B7494_g7230 [Chlorociboria aeruginascens]